MKVHPERQKAKTTTRQYAKKLVHKSIDTTLKLIGFIGLYFYTLLEPLYDPESRNFENKSQGKTTATTPQPTQDLNQEKETASNDNDTGKWANICPGT